MATSPPHGSTTLITVNSLNALAQQKSRPCQNSFGGKLACTTLSVRGDGATCRQDRPESRYRRRHPVRRGGAVERELAERLSAKQALGRITPARRSVFSVRAGSYHRAECGTHHRHTVRGPATFAAQSSLHMLGGLPAQPLRDWHIAERPYEISPSTRSW